MKLKDIWYWTAVVAIAAAGFFFGCQKPGDGVGLDTNGRVKPFVPPDPCATDHASAACAEKCIADPTAAHCVDRCQMDPTLHGCLDQCAARPALPWCPVDSCTLANPPARCAPVSCTATPTLPVCVDSCTANPQLPFCTPVTVDSCDVAAGTVKPVSCLDRQFFQDSVQPIFAQYCPSCHAKPSGQGYSLVKLSLEPADAWDSLVNHKSKELTKMMRVLPGVPDSSYLIWKITADKRIMMSSMPAAPNPPLSAENIAIIRKWIQGKK
jgi:hypothetical protein